MIYKTSLDSLAKGITIGVAILFALISFGQYFLMNRTEEVIPMYISIALLLIYFVAFALRPIYYNLTNETLIIHRLFKDVKIDRVKIKSVEMLSKDEFGLVIRTFGVGGLFGYYGQFANSKLGSMTWYATRKDRIFLIRTMGNKKIVLTPNDPNKFVADFHA